MRSGKLCGLFVLGTLSSTAAEAGGLYLQEYGTPAMGAAGAGAQARADDASTAFFNPAGMTRLEQTQTMGGAGILQSDVRFDKDSDTPIAGGNGGQAGGTAPILSLNHAQKITDDLSAGLSLISISGAVLDYNNSWAGRFQNQKVELLTLSIQPTLAYRINEYLSVGAGALILYGNLDADVAVPPPNGTGRVKIRDADDFDAGFVGGILVEPTQQTRFGITYQSKVEPKLGGDVDIQPAGAQAAIDLKLPLAERVQVAAYHEINEQVALLGSFRWENWSKFGNIPVSVEQGSTNVDTGWRDTYGFSLGAQYRPTKKWMLQAGFGYDTSPVSDGNRTAALPIDEQFRYAVGAQYDLTERINLGGSFVYADYGDAKIDSDLLKGSYKNNDLYFFTLNFSYKFGEGPLFSGD
ncbi:MAG: outer membrane protein transport protein [Pseudomonadota bacterium]